MARLHGATAYIVHMTCKESVHALERAKLAGQRCYGETCPQYLLLDDTVFDKPDFGGSAFVMSPPIRPGHVGHHDALWHSLTNRMLDSVGTDHCPFTHAQKQMGLGDFTKIPNGAAGIEDRLALLYTFGVKGGRFDLCRMVELGSAAPARIFGLANKGAIGVGMDADIAILDPSGTRTLSARTHHSKADRSIFEGTTVQGRIARTIAAGRTIWDGAKLTTTRGAGRFIARKPSHFTLHAEVKT
jgi:dihydropyrimidinase